PRGPRVRAAWRQAGTATTTTWRSRRARPRAARRPARERAPSRLVRQEDREPAPLALLRLHGHAAPVRQHHAAHDGEAEAGAAPIAVRLAPRVEDARQGRGRDADAGVLHLDLDLRPRVDEPHGDAAAPQREADGVGHEVDDHLHEPILVAADVEALAHALPREREPALLRLRPQLLDRASD